ncbi:hypothetical protein [Cognatitamlana onchidii]|uniref:hypothetical protein n=1 Tax=Cognatitamlana onchidii TaxID=2562860 RepID=UPI0010A68F25|nr:hypothetical protein [Algibacter onchidii]
MKRIISNTKKAFLMVALFATIMGFANDAKILIDNKTKTTALVLEDVKKGNQIYIKDNNGFVLYKELIETNGIYKKGFDLNNLPDGTYIFEVEKDLEINTIPFTVKANHVVFNEEQESTIFKPHTRQEDDLVFISKLASSAESISIKVYAVYNDSSALVHSENIENETILERIYKLEKGQYKIVINANNKTYTTFISN